MTAKIFIDLATQPFVADLVFPNGIPKGGYVTLFVGCCQRTPQPGNQVDFVALQKDSSSAIPVVRKTCHNQTYTEFCDGKIYVRNGPSGNGGANYPCNLRHSFEPGILTEKEHSRLHIQREVPELCGDIKPILKSEGSCDCFYCGFGGSSRDETLRHEIYHGGLVQSCIVCQRRFKNESTLSQHLCNHVRNGFHCSVCSKAFLSKELHARHVRRNSCSPAPKTEPLRQLEVPPPRPATVVEPVVVPPPKPPCRTKGRARVHATSAAIHRDSSVTPTVADGPPSADDCPPDAADCSVEVAVSPANVPSPSAAVGVATTDDLLAAYSRRPRMSCPYCPRFCFSTAALQVHLRRKHIANAPLKCPHCPRRFFVDTLFYKHRSICTRKRKDVKTPIIEPKKNRWTRLHCEYCDFRTQVYEQLTDHYAENHKEHALNTCQTCSARFAHHAYMLVHQVQVHRLSEDDQPQTCSLCDLSLDNMNSLRDHLLEVHAPAPIYRCFECLERFSTAASALSHRDEKHNPNSVDCPECPKKFKNALACRRHIVYTHYSARLVHSCKFCYRRYKNLLTLRYHLALSHINELTEEERASLEPLKKHCKQCDYVTFNRRSMVGHLRRKHGGMLQCPHCPSQFAQVAELTRHQRLRHGTVGRQQCPHCPRGFVCPKSYEIHLKMHEEGRGHECTVCQRLFESEAILRHHGDSHDARKNRNSRRCKTCLRVFASVHYLSKHQERYRAEAADGSVVLTCTAAKGGPVRQRDRRSFTLTCDECHLRFKYQSSLSAHKMALHGNSSKDGKSFTCDICQHSFVSVLGLSSHIRTHTGERPFTCEECGASFSQASTLREHRVLKHSRAFREVCPLCSKGCVSKTKLRKHLQAAHKAMITCAQPAAPRRPSSSASSTPARQPSQPAASESAHTYVLPDLENPEESYQAPEEECIVLHEELGEDMVPQVVAVATEPGSTHLAVAVDSIINLMVCDTLIETNCIELTSEEPHGGEEVVG